MSPIDPTIIPVCSASVRPVGVSMTIRSKRLLHLPLGTALRASDFSSGENLGISSESAHLSGMAQTFLQSVPSFPIRQSSCFGVANQMADLVTATMHLM